MVQSFTSFAMTDLSNLIRFSLTKSDVAMNNDIETVEESMGLGERFIYMLLFAISYSVAEIVLWVVVVFQFLTIAFMKERNEQLLNFGQQLATYIYQIVRFLSFNSEERPFPVGEWPKG